MGKNKIKILRLETEKSRKIFFRKRLRGIMKKAEEFAILCDAPILLLTNSPSDADRFSLATHNCNLEQAIQLYAAKSPENRYKAKLDVIKKLCNAYKEEHIINVEELLQQRSPLPEKNKVEQQKSQLVKLKEEISQIQRIMGPLGYLPDLEKIECLNTLTAMENCLLELLKQNNLKRELFGWNSMPFLM